MSVLSGEDIVEVIDSHEGVFFGGGVVDHGLEVIIAGVFLSDFLGDETEVVDGDLSGSVEVEKAKRLVNRLTVVLLGVLAPHHVYKLEVGELLNFAFAAFCENLEEVLPAGVEPQVNHNLLHLLGSDRAFLVHVEQVERVLDFLLLPLRQPVLVLPSLHLFKFSPRSSSYY